MNKKITVILTAILLISIIIFIGCESKKESISLTEISNTEQKKIDESSVIIGKFNSLMLLEPTEKELIDFIDENISKTEENYADKMILDFEKIQNSRLEIRTLNFYRENIQSMIKEEFSDDGNIKLSEKFELEDMENIDLKNYISSYLDMGYMVIKNEVGFVPYVNYNFYSKYKPYVSDEVKFYIDIRSLEIEDPIIINNNINLTWDEVFQRALYYEKFLLRYQNSNRYDIVKEIYDEYVKVYLLGTDLTPAFLEDLSLRKYLRQSYDNVYLDNIDSKLVVELRKYFSVLKKEGNLHTDIVKEAKEKVLFNLEIGEFN